MLLAAGRTNIIYLALPNVAEDQSVAKDAEDICLIGSRRNPETVEAIAIDVEQSQAQQKAKRARVVRQQTKVTVAFENPLDQLLAFRSQAQDRQRDRNIIQEPMSAAVVEVKRRNADFRIVSQILWSQVSMDHANLAESITLQI